MHQIIDDNKTHFSKTVDTTGRTGSQSGEREERRRKSAHLTSEVARLSKISVRSRRGRGANFKLWRKHFFLLFNIHKSVWWIFFMIRKRQGLFNESIWTIIFSFRLSKKMWVLKHIRKKHLVFLFIRKSNRNLIKMALFTI